MRRLADATERAWEVLLAPDWSRIRAVLEADVAYRARRLAGAGLEGLFSDLHPHVRWNDPELTVSTPARLDLSRSPDGQGILLMPSVFAWPDVVSGFAPPWQPTLIYPARGVGDLWTSARPRTRPYSRNLSQKSGQQWDPPPPRPQSRNLSQKTGQHRDPPQASPSTPTPPDALARLLGPNRAALLHALDEPASTTALAHRLGLAPSSVSAHLAVLRAAGLLGSHRLGREVHYARTPLGDSLVAVRERRSPQGGGM